jgi:NAD(P)-dependent dehydrogenase (short-subunit alcohol dehydrogenase family)
MAQTVLVTGAAGALGGKVVERLVADSYKVVGSDRVSPARAPVGARWLTMDLGDPQAIRDALGREEVGALVHCAGGFRYAEVENTSDEDLDFLIDANFRSTFHLLRELLPGMKKRGRGRIVLISSRATLRPAAGMGAYCATKAALNALVGSLAEETRAHGINVNAVLPTVIDTPANRRDMAGADFTQWVRPEAIAQIISSLLGPWGDPIHGALLPVAGRL